MASEVKGFYGFYLLAMAHNCFLCIWGKGCRLV